jgi:UDP-N-acetylglucosamine--N-acetylmuramyl-(pentapeptide) pyrophosphoryl-undecaprenol N-acetylglucosamine transferase
VAQAFRAEHPDGELLMVGRRGGLEETLVPREGVPLETIEVRGFDRDFPWKNAVLPVVLPRAFAHGSRIVGRFRPDVVLGVGGYVMAPALIGARLHGIPYVLAVFEASGLANRLFRPGAAAACVTFPHDVERFRTPRTEFTGFPLRPGFDRHEPRIPARRLLITGASTGARRINEAVWGALPQLLDRFEEVVHLTGAQGEARSEEFLRNGYRPIAFTHRMSDLLGEADLVICRCGVGTISEVTAVGLPMICVPGTFGGGHQNRLSEELEAAGAALRIPDPELTPDRLVEAVDGLDADRLRRMTAASAAMGRPGAAEAVLRVLEEVAA